MREPFPVQNQRLPSAARPADLQFGVDFGCIRIEIEAQIHLLDFERIGLVVGKLHGNGGFGSHEGSGVLAIASLDIGNGGRRVEGRNAAGGHKACIELRLHRECIHMAQLFRSSAMRRFAGMTAICLMLAIAVLSVMPPGDLPPVEGSDKLKHFIAYGSLGGAIAIAAGPGRAFLITIGYGALMEVAQALAPTGREYSILDEVANMLGAGLGTGIALALRR